MKLPKETLNGQLGCHFEEWLAVNGHKIQTTHEKVEEMHDSMKQVAEHTSNLIYISDIVGEMKITKWLMVLIVGTFCLIFLIREVGDRGFSITPSGVKIDGR